MDLIIEIAKLGVVGIFAAVMYKQALDERKAHDVTRAALVQSILDRLQDSKESTQSLTKTSQSMAESINNMSNKIENARVR